MTLALSRTFNVNSTLASTSFFLRLFKDVLFASLSVNPVNLIYLSRLKGSVTSGGRPLKKATAVYKKEINVASKK